MVKEGSPPSSNSLLRGLGRSLPFSSGAWTVDPRSRCRCVSGSDVKSPKILCVGIRKVTRKRNKKIVVRNLFKNVLQGVKGPLFSSECSINILW